MRWIVIFLGLVLAMVGGFAYWTYENNPAACVRLGRDLADLFHSIRSDVEGVVPAATTNEAPVTAAAPVPAASTNEASAPAPAPSTAGAPATTNAVPVASDSAPAPGATKPWAPPDVMPAQPHWEWTASDGKVYEDVVVTKIEPETVSIQHAAGVAHVEISSLPPEIQKRLNYDPEAARAAKAEDKREEAHPFYRVAELADAQKAARELHRPLAWMDSGLEEYSRPDPPLNSEDELAHMAVDHLKSWAIVIFIDGNTELGALSPVVRDQQLFQFDDGPVPGGHHFYAPKIVFTDADVAKPLGRVTYTEMKATREVAIDEVVDAIAQGRPAPVPVPPTVRTQ